MLLFLSHFQSLNTQKKTIINILAFSLNLILIIFSLLFIVVLRGITLNNIEFHFNNTKKQQATFKQQSLKLITA